MRMQKFLLYYTHWITQAYSASIGGVSWVRCCNASTVKVDGIAPSLGLPWIANDAPAIPICIAWAIFAPSHNDHTKLPTNVSPAPVTLVMEEGSIGVAWHNLKSKLIAGWFEAEKNGKTNSKSEGNKPSLFFELDAADEDNLFNISNSIGDWENGLPDNHNTPYLPKVIIKCFRDSITPPLHGWG